MSSNLPDGITVEIHSKHDCGSCTEAKAWLAERGIPYAEILHNDREERRSFYRDVLRIDPEKGTVPQIFLVETDTGHKTPIGNLDALKRSGLV